MRSIQEIETGRESAFKRVDEKDIEIAKHDYILAWGRSIADERKWTACDEPLARLNEKRHGEEMKMVIAERRLGAFGKGRFDLRWNRWKALEARWWSAIEAIVKHRSSCPHCLARR